MPRIPTLLLTCCVLLLLLPGCADRHASPQVELAKDQNDALRRSGEQVFSDPRFSVGRDISCATCHQPQHHFADLRTVSIGAHANPGTRNAPSLLGLPLHGPLFWDGRHTDLHLAVTDALTNPREMGLRSEAEVVLRLKESPEYVGLIRGNDAQSMEALRVALVAHLQSLPKNTSRFELSRSSHDKSALDEWERAGLNLFTGKARCSQCHTLSNGSLTDNSFHHTGIGFENVSGNVASILLKLQTAKEDKNVSLGHMILADRDIGQLGRFVVTGNADDLGAFRTPSLRNVAATAPYMHDGSVPTLEAAVDREIYYRGLNENAPISLTAEERDQLISFIKTFSDTN
ncbi:MAG: cytochrome-c peroxidase [Arenimonas sp.]